MTRLVTSWVGHHVAWAAEAGADGRARAVDDRFDAARSVQEHSEQVMELNARSIGCLERHRVLDRHALVEVAVAAHSVALERGDAVGDVEGRIAVLGRTRHPGRLARHLVGVLVLEEDHLSALAVPDDLVPLVVLHRQAVSNDIVAIDDEPGVALVGGPGAGAAPWSARHAQTS